MDVVFHYPPELLQLLIDTIPLLCRSKRDVLLFFAGAGVPRGITGDLAARVGRDKESITKYEIARLVLARLNERGEATLRERREILRRVTEFEDFSTCWPADQWKAKGLVAEIRRVINVKDSFTRMRQERDAERKKHIAERDAKLRAVREKGAELASIRHDLYGLFTQSNPQVRGKQLESVLNRLFKVNGILVREAFARVGEEGEGVVEQIDGVVKIDGHFYFVEMKWKDAPVGKGDVSQHLVRVFGRGYARCIFISASEYTRPAITCCRDALQKTVVVLCSLSEIVMLLEQERDLKEFLEAKIDAAIIDTNPYHKPLGEYSV